MMGAFRQALLLAAAVGAVCAFDIAPVAGAAPAAGEERQQLPMSKTLAMAQDMPDRPPPSAAKEDDEPEAPKEPIGDFQSSPLSSDMMRRSNNNPLNDGAAPDRANGIGQENIDPQTLAPGSVGAVDPLSSDSDSYTLKWARGSEGAGKAGSKAAVTTARPMVEPSSSRKGDASSFRFQRASVATGHKEHVGWQGDMGAMGLATASTPVTPEADLAGAMRPQWNNVAEQPAAAAQAAAPAPVAEPAKAPQPEKKAPFFSPYSPYQYSNGEMHFPVFHGHQLLANQWSTNKKRLVRAGSGLAPPSPAAAAQPTAPPMQPFRFQSLSTRLSSVDHMYPMRGRFQLKGTSPDDAVESKTAAVSSSVRAAFRLKGAAAPPAAAEGERFVRQSVELGHQAAPTPVSAAPASTLADRAASASGWTAPSHQPAGRLMRFMQTGTGMGSGSGSEKKPNHDGPKYNWSPQMPDPNKMQWYQSPAIMYPQTPAMAPAGGAPSTDGADGNFVQTAPTPPAMYLGEAHAGSYPSDLYNAQGLTTPQMSLNLPQAPAPPPKFMEVGAVVGYATPSGVAVSPQQAQQAQQAASAGVARVAPAASATAAPAVSMMQQPVQQQQAQQQVVYQQQQPVQMQQQQQQQQQQPVQYMMQQPQQPVQYVMQQPLAGGVVQQPQQPVQYVMMQQPGVQQQPGQPAQMVQQPQQLQPQQPQQPAAGQPAQQPAAGGAAAPGQQPVVINLVLPNGASAGGAAGLAQAAKPQQAAPAAAPLPDDGFPLAHGHMNVAELSTTSVSDRSAVPKAPSMRGAPPV